ncbi:PAS domain S-box protein [Tahibacter amnicola]|uniref:PAS domain S-box protein n=1 Tax=Tahibacter amnicola TaxID=2976241 RepID=A0ABY6BFA9_9GAMM|nr:PAS domain S-box protein [Tahibacter amnicola]UXI68723.1 PAS domain S-box protein [Tahibacter amnicola]
MPAPHRSGRLGWGRVGVYTNFNRRGGVPWKGRSPRTARRSGGAIRRGADMTAVDIMHAPLKALVVEDNPGDARLLQEVLRSADPPVSVQVCDRVQRALERLRAEPFHVVLLDLGLPDSVGFDGIERLQQEFPHVAVVVLTGHDDDARGAQAIARGAQDYIFKSDLRLDLLQRAVRYAVLRKYQEQQLREHETQMRVLFDLNPQPMWIHDQQSLQFLSVNLAAIKTYGYSERDFLKMTLTHLLSDEEVVNLRRAAELNSYTATAIGVGRHRRKDGTEIAVEVYVQTIPWGTAKAQLVQARDVTVERRAIRAMESSERRFRDLFEYSLGFICTHDADGVLLSVNPAAANALGYRTVEMMGRSLRDLVPDELKQVFDHYLKRIYQQTHDAGLMVLVDRKGERRIWQYQNRLFFDVEGESYVMGHAQDVTERRRYELELKTKQAELEAVNDASPLGLFRTDASGQCTYVNRTFERLSGRQREEAFGDGWLMGVHPDDRERVHNEWRNAVRAGVRYSGMHRYLTDSGDVGWAVVQAAPVLVDDIVVGYVGCAEDITAQHNAERALRLNEERLRTIADALPIVIAYVDRDERMTFVNDAGTMYFGRTSADILGHPVKEILGEERYQRRHPYIERALRGERVTFDDEQGTGNAFRAIEVSYIPQRADDGGAAIGFHVMMQDVTDRKREQRRLIQLVQIDNLTGLLNRAGFLDRLEQAMARSRDQRKPIALMFIDVDKFKSVNDTYGHAVGDHVLKAFADRLTTTLRASDVIARMGGDEFTVILEGISRPENAAATAAKVVTAMARPFEFEEEGLSLQIGASIGVAMYEGSAQSTAELVRQADAQLYEAKQAGRNTYRLKVAGAAVGVPAVAPAGEAADGVPAPADDVVDGGATQP